MAALHHAHSGTKGGEAPSPNPEASLWVAYPSMHVHVLSFIRLLCIFFCIFSIYN